MSFIHGYLLAGLVLAGLPILVHLIMRQKPQQLFFPAFRFLKRRLHVNRRRLRLQHLLLLALRIALIAALCLALAQPSLESSFFQSKVKRPVAAVFLFDTSASMEYVVSKETRLETALGYAKSLLGEMDPKSRVAILDCGDDPGTPADWSSSLEEARDRKLTTRTTAHPVNAHLGRAFALLNSLPADDPSPRLVYIFSDRTRAAWSAAIKAEELPKGVRVVYVDVGAEKPDDYAIDRIEVVPAIVEPGKKMEVFITVRCTGSKGPNQLFWQIDNDPNPRREITPEVFRLDDGKEKTFRYERTAPLLPIGERTAAFQITAKLDINDSLTFNDRRYATFLVRNRRSILTIADDPKVATSWEKIFLAREIGNEIPLYETFRCEVVRTATIEQWKPNPDMMVVDPLLAHDIVCLYQTAQPSTDLWKRLRSYVLGGGNLIIVPAGDEMKEVDRKKFNNDGTTVKLLPATLVKLIDAPGGEKTPTCLKDFNSRHELTRPFFEWVRAGVVDYQKPNHRPSFLRYWEAAPIENAESGIMFYDDGKPALLERKAGAGHVLMFTIPLDNNRSRADGRLWSNIWTFESGFGYVLVDQACLYLVGETGVGDQNFVCGKSVLTPLLARGGDSLPKPQGNGSAPYFDLKGPQGLAQSEMRVAIPDGRLLAVPQATQPGNYQVVGKEGAKAAAFSVNMPTEESRLERVPAEEIEKQLGDKSLLPPGKKPSLSEEVADEKIGKLDLMPWLMMAVLLVLGVESVLANKFYKREPNTAGSHTVSSSSTKEPALTAGTAARSE